MVENATALAVEEAPVDEKDPVEVFIDVATAHVRKINREELWKLRDAALAELRARYGELIVIGDKEFLDFTPESVMKIKNVAHRFMALADMANRAWVKHKEMDKLRVTRGTGIQILRQRFGIKPVKVYELLVKTPYGAKDKRVVDLAMDVGDIRQAPPWPRPLATKKMIEAHTDYTRRETNGDFARPERDKLILAMTEGKAGDKRVWTNAEIYRLAKMTSAAVAQIRTGTAPSAKRAARAA